MWDKTLMAFPCENDHNKEYNWVNKGMTLRDYFAAKAMQGLTANPKGGSLFSDIAIQSYGIADAMLEEREIK